MVRGNGQLNTGASSTSLELVEIPAAGSLHEGGKGNGLETSPMPAGTGVGVVFPGAMSHGGDVHHGRHRLWEVHAGVRHEGRICEWVISLPH